jgi:hypothetical protein
MKNLIIKTKILSVGLTLVLSACSDYLDVNPVGKLIPAKVVEIENLLNNTYTIDFQFLDNNRGCFYAMLGDNITLSPLQADKMYYATHPNMDRYRAYIFYTPYYNLNTTHYFWNWGIYRSVGLFNNTISGIQNLPLPESGSTHAKEVIAEAKAARAWIYLQGAMVYGPVYNPNDANNVKVLPYRTSESPLAPNPPLHTTTQLFEFILQDLTDALEAPELVGNPTRAGKTAVLALHAQYYLYKRDWDNAYKYADEAWKLALNLKGNDVGKLIYDYNDFEYQKNSSNYAAGVDSAYYWTLRHKGGDNDFRQSYNRESLLYRISPTGVSHYPSDEYVALFDTVSKADLRYKLFILKYTGYRSGTDYDGIRLYNYRGNRLLYNEGLTYPDLLLMRAEASVRSTAQTAKALADLNMLRKYRFDNSKPTDLLNGSSLTADQLLEEILKERRREQPFESFQRTVDIKRYTLDVGKPWCKTTITHLIGDKVYSAPVNNQYFNVPIDNAVISFNPEWGLTPDNTTYIAKPE